MESETEKGSPSFKVRLIQESQDKKALSDLLDASFAVPQGKKFFDDFPVWDSDYFPNAAIVGAFEGSELASCAGVRVAELKAPNRQFLTAIIGAVATNSRWRGNGLASTLVNQAVKAAETQKAEAVFLWGSKHDMYRKLGFELCGLQVRVPSDLVTLPQAPENVQKGWNQGVFNRLMEKSDGLAIKPSDVDWLGAHKNVNWYWIGEPEDPTAYVGFGRGIDLQGIVHEWGGDVDAVLGLMAHLKKNHGKVELLGSPARLKALGIPFPEDKMEFLCMARVLRPEAVFNSFHEGVNFKATEKEGFWNLELEGTRLEGFSSAQVSMLFFGPEKLEGIWEKYFPLPLWFWGLDAA